MALPKIRDVTLLMGVNKIECRSPENRIKWGFERIYQGFESCLAIYDMV